jgi:hypothetical protein
MRHLVSPQRAADRGDVGVRTMFPTLPSRPDRAHAAAACLAILGLVLAACGASSPSGPGKSQTIHVFEPARNVTEVLVGSLTGCTNEAGCQGDYVLGDDPLLDATSKQEVGRLLFECFRVDTASTLFHCPGNTITLTGRGRIVYTEDVHFAPGYPPEQWPITGGTGEFVGATGFVTSPADSTYSEGGDFVITID